MKKTSTQSQQGFAMLFTVLVMSLILTIALGISDVTFKQTILSAAAQDSGVAFYQADAGMECALYYDFKLLSFNGVNVTPDQIQCGNAKLSGGETDTNVYVYKSDPSSGPCIGSITIDKSLTVDPLHVTIVSRGNNICQSNPRQVERALQVSYSP